MAHNALRHDQASIKAAVEKLVHQVSPIGARSASIGAVYIKFFHALARAIARPHEIGAIRSHS